MALTDEELLADAPLLAAWLRFTRSGAAPFTIPGHKGAAARLWPVLGSVLSSDVPLYGGLDTVKLTGGFLADAEARAARLWGGDWCRFSTGGSTHANQVMTMAAAGPGDQVLVSRSAHRSTLSGLVLAGPSPIWLPTSVDGRFGIPGGLDSAVLGEAIRANPLARAVFLVEPSYLGTRSDLAALVDAAHDAGLPVLVDQAWGAHFGFHPDLPAHALAEGADALVVSAHKTLPAYSQASLIVARTDRLDPDRLERAFEVGNTTSPAGSILASTDGARALLAARGPELLGWLIGAVDRARRRLREVPGLVVPGPDDFAPHRFDPAKLVVLFAGTGASGVTIERDLVAAGLPVEMADHDTLVPIVTLADTDETVHRLVETLVASVERHRDEPRIVVPAVHWHLGTPDPTARPAPPDPTGRPARPEPTGRPAPPEPTGRPTRPEPTGRPTRPDPTARPAPDPTARPAPDPTARPAPDPTARPAPDPTARPAPDPTSRLAPPDPTAPPGPIARPAPLPAAPPAVSAASSPGVPALTPREAFFARHRAVPAEAAIGRVSAELVAPYPPGIPVLVPGEVISADAVRALRAAAALGTRIAYAADPSLDTLQVVDGD